jgi:hypothetical protein
MEVGGRVDHVIASTTTLQAPHLDFNAASSFFNTGLPVLLVSISTLHLCHASRNLAVFKDALI